MFYYFLESERNPKNDPLILWLSGGPGCSNLYDFFYEIGPLTFNYEKSRSNKKPTLELSPYSWTKVANVIFLDQPVGTGFSYAKNLEASRTSDTLSAEQTYEFLRKWLTYYSKFIDNPLYICGVSYTGILIPAIVQKIYTGNEEGHEPQMNIKGYMIGNPVTDKINEFNSRVEYSHRFALLPDELYESFKGNCLGDYTQLRPTNAFCQNDVEAINKCLANINFQHILEPLCEDCTQTSNMPNCFGSSVQDNPIFMETWCRSNNYPYATMWANDKAVQKALHIREGTIVEWVRCNPNITYEFGENAKLKYSFDLESSINYHQNLTNKRCRVLIFSGDHDLVVPYLSTEKWIRSLNLRVEESWRPWFLGDQVAGYTLRFSQDDYSLAFATVKGAGHTPSEYKPKECLAMVDRWFADYPI
ncbi:hypothetical protein LguiB_022032 [Lonicera macranthoides]